MVFLLVIFEGPDQFLSKWLVQSLKTPLNNVPYLKTIKDSRRVLTASKRFNNTGYGNSTYNNGQRSQALSRPDMGAVQRLNVGRHKILLNIYSLAAPRGDPRMESFT
jgi:hypothetical protein